MKASDDVSARSRGITVGAVHKQVDRILASKLFNSSPRQQLLLRTIVAESVAGHDEALKEIVLSREVFGRPEYDPRRHTLVRVEVNAVRRKLAEYYAHAGRDDKLRIEIPPGHYVAVFSPVRKQPRRGDERTRWYVIAGCGAALLAAVVLVLVRRQSHPAPTYVPLQITFDTGATAEPAVSRDGSVMVYTSDRGPHGNAEIWIQQARKAPRQLTDDPAHDHPGRFAGWEAYRVSVVAKRGGDLVATSHGRDTEAAGEGRLSPKILAGWETTLGSDGQLGDIHPLPFALGANGVRFVRSGKHHLSILFAPERRQTNIWKYDLADSDRLEQLTHDNTMKPGTYGTWPALSGDGSVLAFITDRAGSPNICLKQILTGAEQLLGASPSAHSPLILNRDGSEIVFERKQGSTVSVVLRDIAKRTDRILTTSCPTLQDWSKDRKLLLCTDGSDLFQIRIGDSGKIVVLHPPREPEFARFSPDARWISYVSTAGQGENVVGYLAPLDASNRTIQIDQEVYTLSLNWSADGNAIYFWSVRDGFRCLYMQRLDRRTKIPEGAPVAILHRHEWQHYPWSGGTLAVSSGRIAFTLTDELANIWKADLPR